MAQLRRDYARFVELETQIITVGPENAGAFERYWKENDLPFVGLPDPKHQVLKRFGQEVNLFKLGRMPAQVIIDKEGIARYVHYGRSMQDIPPNEELLGIIHKLNLTNTGLTQFEEEISGIGVCGGCCSPPAHPNSWLSILQLRKY